jgi:hypothetical protein
MMKTIYKTTRTTSSQHRTSVCVDLELNLEKISEAFSLRKILSVYGLGFGKGNPQEKARS